MSNLIDVIEDDADIRAIIAYLLQDENYEIQTFSTITEFKEDIKTKLPDLVISDIVLPDGQGTELCRQLKTTEDMKHIPVILMSAYFEPSEIAHDVCCDNFIPKPFDITNLKEIVKSHLPV